MKPLAFIFLILCLIKVGVGQSQPLTQQEYVKMLYAAEKDPGVRSDIVDALRKRGISFVVTDGIRGLTRTNGANNDELRRALDEADRRRRDPVATRLPTEIEAKSILEKTKANTQNVVEEMPDFVVKQ